MKKKKTKPVYSCENEIVCVRILYLPEGRKMSNDILFRYFYETSCGTVDLRRLFRLIPLVFLRVVFGGLGITTLHTYTHKREVMSYVTSYDKRYFIAWYVYQKKKRKKKGDIINGGKTCESSSSWLWGRAHLRRTRSSGRGPGNDDVDGTYLHGVHGRGNTATVALDSRADEYACPRYTTYLYGRGSYRFEWFASR